MQKALILGAAVLAVATSASARDLRIVGSSTVFPFASAVIEQFSNKTGLVATIESTGSGGGMKLFCAGVGEDTPDITNASRRVKDKEVKLCADNGVTNVTEVKIGFDGISILSSINAEPLDLTKEDLFNALNATLVVNGEKVANPNKTWADVNPGLPKMAIKVMGPPPSSGTRDAFEEIVMEKLAEHAGVALALREDGAYIEAGENDNLIVEKLSTDTALLGIAGFSFLDQNSDRVQGALIDGVEPSFDNIADGLYPIARSLWFYVKNDHRGVIRGIEDYVAEFTNEDTWGPDGYLADLGMINLPDEERQAPSLDGPSGKFAQ